MGEKEEKVIHKVEAQPQTLTNTVESLEDNPEKKMFYEANNFNNLTSLSDAEKENKWQEYLNLKNGGKNKKKSRKDSPSDSVKKDIKEKKQKEILEVKAQPQTLTNTVESLEVKREVKPIIQAKKKRSPRRDHKKTKAKSQGDKRDKVSVSEYLTTVGETVGGAADDMLTGKTFKKMGGGIDKLLERITPA